MAKFRIYGKNVQSIAPRTTLRFEPAIAFAKNFLV